MEKFRKKVRDISREEVELQTAEGDIVVLVVRNGEVQKKSAGHFPRGSRTADCGGGYWDSRSPQWRSSEKKCGTFPEKK